MKSYDHTIQRYSKLIENSSLSSSIEWGDVRALSIGGQSGASTVTEVHWTVPLIQDILKASIPLVLSPKFYVSVPGHRIQLMLIPNSTFSDNFSFMGIFFRLVTGEFDSDLEWPYQYKTFAGFLPFIKDANDTDPIILSPANSWTVIPNRDPCRLRSAFLRPSTDTDNFPRPDGCGSRRLVDIKDLGTFIDEEAGSLTIVAKIDLSDRGAPYDNANFTFKHNDLISEYVWSIKNFPKIQAESVRSSSVAVLSSDPFYTHPSGYLIQVFLTLLPTKNAFAISTAFLQGDFDRSLDWPYPYPFEVALIDQSPSYWKRDYAINLDASSADCGSAPFLQPTQSVEFCFITVQSMELLTLTHYNFVKDGILKIRFQTKVMPMSRKPVASLSIKNKHLVSEYSWLIPNIENKLERFDYSGRKIKVFTSEKFYTNSQGKFITFLLVSVVFMAHVMFS